MFIPKVPVPHTHDDVIKWKKFPCYWPFVRGIGYQWGTALILSLICAWTNSWANNRDAGDLRRHRTQYDVTVMITEITENSSSLRLRMSWNITLTGHQQAQRRSSSCICFHNSEVIMSAMAFQITGVSIICSTVCSGAYQRKSQSPALLVFVRGMHRWLVDSPHKGSVTRNTVLLSSASLGCFWPRSFSRWVALTLISWGKDENVRIQRWYC